MMTHLLVLTIDTDPDGLSGPVVNRAAISWESLNRSNDLLLKLEKFGAEIGLQIPITWFIRADGQLRKIWGKSGQLLEEFNGLWKIARVRGDELSWHPHLYRCQQDVVELISDPNEASDEIERLWYELSDYDFKVGSFRNGEGWHHPKTYKTVERLGFEIDSTAIPGRRAIPPHPMDWLGAPNCPYFPMSADLRKPGEARPLLEIPMNTWQIKAPYDKSPQLRCMNPAVHEELFNTSLLTWGALIRQLEEGIHVWVLVLHPDDALGNSTNDSLYARSTETVCQNLMRLYLLASETGDRVEFVTISEAGKRWRKYAGALS
ncbi:hypothetical protein ACFL27_07340 [candidate division CSSED10-310 bacterium]|uniref:NodB homology domain-containing protein n=1 Tax=candidate division CSSED10-310 bacterium TaxID=2855610 RepID=A0ABV6YUV3_UNCC1